jgi:predicted dehydrogenase
LIIHRSHWRHCEAIYKGENISRQKKYPELESYYSKDLLLDSKTRGVYDIVHEVVAIGSSSSVESAQKFAKEVGAQGAKHYGAYEDLVKDPNVDVVYVAS